MEAHLEFSDEMQPFKQKALSLLSRFPAEHQDPEPLLDEACDDMAVIEALMKLALLYQHKLTDARRAISELCADLGSACEHGHLEADGPHPFQESSDLACAFQEWFDAEIMPLLEAGV